MNKFSTVAELVKHFEETVIDPKAGEVQKADMRMCFWAGAIAMFHEITERPNHMSEAEACAMLSHFQREFIEHGIGAILQASIRGKGDIN